MRGYAWWQRLLAGAIAGIAVTAAYMRRLTSSRRRPLAAVAVASTAPVEPAEDVVDRQDADHHHSDQQLRHPFVGMHECVADDPAAEAEHGEPSHEREDDFGGGHVISLPVGVAAPSSVWAATVRPWSSALEVQTTCW